jgi:hypothetical protein
MLSSVLRSPRAVQVNIEMTQTVDLVHKHPAVSRPPNPLGNDFDCHEKRKKAQKPSEQLFVSFRVSCGYRFL